MFILFLQWQFWKDEENLGRSFFEENFFENNIHSIMTCFNQVFGFAFAFTLFGLKSILQQRLLTRKATEIYLIAATTDISLWI